ncbi:MAG: CoA transferase [Chloroflexi bacterium]|nr:CoA transferase [Chloroflexota bacterium]
MGMVNSAGRALYDLRVLEISRTAAGAFCGSLLASLGAEVLLLEQEEGHPLRRQHPLVPGQPDANADASIAFDVLNSGKRSIRIDLGSLWGQRKLMALARLADVILEDGVSGQPQEYQDAKHLWEQNPSLIVATISPFGQAGSTAHYRACVGCDLIEYHAGGLGYLTRAYQPSGEPTQPLTAPDTQARMRAGSVAAAAILAALLAREVDGSGRRIDVSTQEAVAAVLAEVPLAVYQLEGRVVGSMPVMGPTTKPFLCQDGMLFVGLVELHQWKQLFSMMGEPEWSKDELLTTMEGIVSHRDLLVARVQDWLLDVTIDEFVREATPRRIPFAIVADVAQSLTHPQLRSRELFCSVAHPTIGEVFQPKGPCLFSETPVIVAGPAPQLGAHNLWCEKDLLG